MWKRKWHVCDTTFEVISLKIRRKDLDQRIWTPKQTDKQQRIETDQWLLTNSTRVFQPITSRLNRPITFNRPDFITSSTDNYSSLDSEDDYRTDSRNVSHQQQFFSELHSPGRSHYTKYFMLSNLFLNHCLSDNKVLIVIGGDDEYRQGEDEEEQFVISRWARRKVASQFDEDDLDGRKSFSVQILYFRSLGKVGK